MVIFVFLFLSVVVTVPRYLFGDEDIGDWLEHGVGEEVGEQRGREEGQIGAGVATVVGRGCGMGRRGVKGGRGEGRGGSGYVRRERGGGRGTREERGTGARGRRVTGPVGAQPLPFMDDVSSDSQSDTSSISFDEMFEDFVGVNTIIDSYDFEF